MEIQTDIDLPQLYTHRHRREWGLAILAWEGRDKRRFQFQDGKARTFKKGYYALLEEVDRPLDITAEVVADLERMLDVNRARRQLIEQAQAAGRTIMTLRDQVRIFRHLYPGGFEDPAFLDDFRGRDAKRRLKRHVDPAVAEAQEAFGEARLRGLIADGEFQRLHEDAVRVLNGTSLTSGRTHSGYLDAMPEGQWRAFGEALYAMLWGAEKLEARFDTLVEAIRHGDGDDGQDVGWPLATAFGALTFPERHVCVKPSVFRQQARWMAPRLDHDTLPSGAVYARYLRMAERVRERIVQAGLEPGDLLDVHAFIWTTLRPKARAVLDELKRNS